MKHHKNRKEPNEMKPILKAILLCTLALVLTLLTVGCNAAPKSYANHEAYSHLYEETDSEDAKQLKHVIIAHIDAYNNGDAEGYYELFNMEKEDLNFNVAQFASMRQNAILTYHPESIMTAFVNEDNAQALITMTCRAEDKTSGEVLYYYRTDMTYTMVRDGKWKITLQTPGAEEDLMSTLTESDTAAQ